MKEIMVNITFATGSQLMATQLAQKDRPDPMSDPQPASVPVLRFWPKSAHFLSSQPVLPARKIFRFCLYLCVCVCVCERDRQTDRERVAGGTACMGITHQHTHTHTFAEFGKNPYKFPVSQMPWPQGKIH